MSAPNLIERMENLIHCIDEASDDMFNIQGFDPDAMAKPVLDNLSNAAGIAGEILTMIDGR